MDGGQLHIVAVDGLFYHCFMQCAGILPAGGQVAAFRLGGYRHQQGAGAAGQVGHIERCREFVVTPIYLRRPALKHQPRQQGCRRHGGVVGAGEFGVGEQGVEQAAGQVVPFQTAGSAHRLLQRRNGVCRQPRRAGVQLVKDGAGQRKHRHIVNGAADLPPNIPQSGGVRAAVGKAQRLPDGADGGVHCGEALLKCHCVEQHQAADAEGGAAVGFPVGFGDDVGDGAGDAGVGGDGLRRPFHGVADDAGRRHYPVDALQFQGQGAQLVGQIGYGTTAGIGLRVGRPAGAVRPPLQVIGGGQFGAQVVRRFQAGGIEDAHQRQLVGEVLPAVVQLGCQQAGGVIPLAFQQDGIAGFERYLDVGGAPASAAFRAGRQAIFPQQFG